MIMRRLFYSVFFIVSVVMVGGVTGSVMAQRQTSAVQTSGCSAQVGTIDEWQNGKVFDDSVFALGSKPLTRIEVRYGNIVDTIEAFYGSESAGLHGVTNPDAQPSVVTIAPNDALVEVSGYYGSWFGQDYILKLTFRTRQGKTFGPYGDMGYGATLAPFTFRARGNTHIAGFCGGNLPANNGTTLLLGALGVIIEHDQESACSGWVGDYGIDQFGIPFDDTAFAQGSTPLSQLKIHYGNIIDSIEAFYGSQSAGQHSTTNSASRPAVIKVAPDDPLVEVYGSYGTWFGANYILQLTFVTRSGKAFGPYGNMAYAENISPFVISAGDGRHIAGFCGVNSPADNGNMTVLGALGVIPADD